VGRLVDIPHITSELSPTGFPVVNVEIYHYPNLESRLPFRLLWSLYFGWNELE
jgi:hypothetical protein